MQTKQAKRKAKAERVLKDKLSNAPEFASVAAAQTWLKQKVNDPCVDNLRFAYLDDPAALLRYTKQASAGCCGFADEIVKINGRPAKIGCNFGH